MKKRNVSEWIADYIKEEGLSAKEIAFRLKIPEAKLKGGREESLSAEEFLALCSYLRIMPERIREELER